MSTVSPIRPDIEEAVGLSSVEVIASTGCSWRQLDYWCRTGRIRPLGGGTPGSGHNRFFSESEVKVIRLAVQVLDFKLSVDAALDYARQLVETGTVFDHRDGVHLILHVPSEAS